MSKKSDSKAILKAYSSKVEPRIKQCLTKDIYFKFKPLALHQILTGGKRLRPALAMLSCQMLGGKIKDALYPAAGLEILHNYTLIIDDIIDNGVLRRGQPSTWVKYGKSMAECAGVYYAAAIFKAANCSSLPQKVSEVFSQTVKEIVNGEVFDILFERQGRKDEPFVVKNRPRAISQRQYLYMISKKTASLIEASCCLGGLCAKGSSARLKQLKSFGFNLGMAFQIKDDLLDVFGDGKKFGKQIGKDIEQRKGGNIVLLYAMEELAAKENKQIKNIMQKSKISKKDIAQVIALLSKTKAKQKAETLGKKYIAKAKKQLKKLPQNKYNQILCDMADFIFSRFV